MKAHKAEGHGIHSPFVFAFVQEVLNDPKMYDECEKIEDLRSELIKNRTAVPEKNLGANSRMSGTKTVSSIAKNVAKPEKYAKLIYRVVKNYVPSTIIELGTSLGISTASLAFGNPDAQVISIEGNETVAELAEKNMHELGISNARIVKGYFEKTLSKILESVQTVDMVFFDGNHRYQPTIDYFKLCLTKKNNGSIFIFDDIHWSEEMEYAWEEIKANGEVMCTIDLFQMGFVFFRKEFLQKQHFIINF